MPGANGRYISRHFFSGEPGVNDYTKESASLGYEFRHDFGDGTVFNQNARYSWAEVDASHGSLGLFGLESPDSTRLLRYYYPRLDTSESVAIDNNLTFRFHSGRVEHTVLAGLDYRRARDDYASAFLFGAPGIDAYNRSMVHPCRCPTTARARVQTKARWACTAGPDPHRSLAGHPGRPPGLGRHRHRTAHRQRQPRPPER